VARRANKLGAMKRSILPLAVVAAIAVSQPACYGSYSATKALNRWNGSLTSNKVTNSIIHFAFWVIPVYPTVFFIGDFLVCNNIEFLTGSPCFK
jgi:hypothetical protein